MGRFVGSARPPSTRGFVVIGFDIHAWAARHGVSPLALAELRDGLTGEGRPQPADDAPTKSESATQANIRLAAPALGVVTWRNNVGALLDKRGVPVRYGLANDSAALNKRIKSADLIGIRRVMVTQEMVGLVIGQFWSRECKRPGWRYSGDEHEQAQLRWAQLVVANGGDAGFATGEGDI